MQETLLGCREDLARSAGAMGALAMARTVVLTGPLLGAMMYVAVDETGRDAVYTHAFYRNVEYAFVTEGWGTEWDEVRRAGVRCLRLCVVT